MILIDSYLLFINRPCMITLNGLMEKPCQIARIITKFLQLPLIMNYSEGSFYSTGSSISS